MSVDAIDLGYGRVKFQVRLDEIPGSFDPRTATSTGPKRRITLLAFHPVEGGPLVQVLQREPASGWVTLAPNQVMPQYAGCLIPMDADVVDLRRIVTRYLLPVSSTSEHGKAIHAWFHQELGKAAHTALGRRAIVSGITVSGGGGAGGSQSVTQVVDQILKLTREDLARALTGAPPPTNKDAVDHAIKKVFEELHGTVPVPARIEKLKGGR